MQDVRREISLVNNFLQKAQTEVATRVQTGKNVVYDQIQMAIMMAEASQNALKAKKATISTQLAALDGDIRELDLRQNELEQIQRDVESYTNNYKIYLGKVEEARIEEQMDIRKMVNVSVIEPPIAPLRPVTPQKALYMALSIMFGMGAAVSSAFALEYFRSGFATPDAASRALGLRILGSVPYRAA